MKKKVTLLIPSRFNSRWLLELSLRTIRKYSDYPYSIIVGDSGVDNDTADFLKAQNDIKVVKCPDPLTPKNYLAKVVETPYFMFLHDDVQILRYGWLSRIVRRMEKNRKIGIVGTLGYNYRYGWNKLFTLACIHKRFFPLAMLVKKEVQDELDLFWGKMKGFDTGAVAYLQFLKQEKWSFVPYKFNGDIKHWGGMTWVVRKKILGGKTSLDLDSLLNERDRKLALIKKIIDENRY